MKVRFAAIAACAVLVGGLAGCVNRPTAAPVGEGGAASIPAPQASGGDSAANVNTDPESLTPLPQAAESHPAPDDTPGVDKAESAAAADSQNPTVNLQLGFSYYKSKAYAQAAPQFLQASRLDPKNAVPLLYLGYTQMAVGALDEAQKTFAGVIALPGVTQENAGEANLQIGNCLWALGKNADAAQSFEKTLRVNPHEGRASLALGTWAAQQKKPAEAKRYFESAARDLSTKHARAQAYACLGRLAQDAKNAAEARANYQKSLALDADNEWAKRATAEMKK